MRYSPIAEIGAGTGYWARLAAEAGADIVAYDSRPPVAGRKKAVAWAVEMGTFFPVRRGGPGRIRFHQDRTLFLCWPPHSHDMAFDSLRRYTGGTVIYVYRGPGWTECSLSGVRIKRPAAARMRKRGPPPRP